MMCYKETNEYLCQAVLAQNLRLTLSPDRTYVGWNDAGTLWSANFTKPSDAMDFLAAAGAVLHWTSGNRTSPFSYDLADGNSEPTGRGDRISLHYAGYVITTNQPDGLPRAVSPPFDSNFDGQAYEFITGSGKNIPGWETGLLGVKAGGTRLVVVPPALAYGDHGQPSYGIPSNASICFICKIVSVTPVGPPRVTAPVPVPPPLIASQPAEELVMRDFAAFRQAQARVGAGGPTALLTAGPTEFSGKERDDKKQSRGRDRSADRDKHRRSLSGSDRSDSRSRRRKDKRPVESDESDNERRRRLRRSGSAERAKSAIVAAAPLIAPSVSAETIDSLRAQVENITGAIARIDSRVGDVLGKVEGMENSKLFKASATQAALSSHQLTTTIQKLVHDSEVATAEISERDDKIAALKDKVGDLRRQNEVLAREVADLHEEKRTVMASTVDNKIVTERSVSQMSEQRDRANRERDDSLRHLATVQKLLDLSDAEVKRLKQMADATEAKLATAEDRAVQLNAALRDEKTARRNAADAAAGLRDSLQEERDRTARLERQLEDLKKKIAAEKEQTKSLVEVRAVRDLLVSLPFVIWCAFYRIEQSRVFHAYEMFAGSFEPDSTFLVSSLCIIPRIFNFHQMGPHFRMSVPLPRRICVCCVISSPACSEKPKRAPKITVAKMAYA